MSRGWLLAGVVVLYVISIPWYRSPDASVEIWFGLPDWVAVALACYVGAAILNALAWLRTDVPEAEPAAEFEPAREAQPASEAGFARDAGPEEGAP